MDKASTASEPSQTAAPVGDANSIDAALRYPGLLRKVPYPEEGMEALLDASRSCLKDRSSGLRGSCLLRVRMRSNGQVDSIETLRSSSRQIELGAKCAVFKSSWRIPAGTRDRVELWLPLDAEWLHGDSAVHRAASQFAVCNWTWLGHLLPPEIRSALHYAPPEPEGGLEAIQRNVVYPEIARKAGVEGRVVVVVLVGEDGQILCTKIAKSLGRNGCDEAAIDAIRSVRWRPAQLMGRPMPASVAVPVIFRLDRDR